MIPMDNHFVPPSTTTTGLVFPANYAASGLHLAVDSSALVAGVKPEASLVMNWSPEEQYVLENSLAKLTNEPKISKYVKIAASLPDKTVRDVALRCRWMRGKRRKRKENSAGKNISSRKVVDTSPELSMLASVPQQNALYFMNNMCHSTHMPCEGLSDAVMDLLQQNTQAFSQISYNLSACKLQDNISLFYQTRNNISAILTDMKEMPGIMSRMPALPVLFNDDLASHLFSSTTANVIHHSTKYPPEARAKKLMGKGGFSTKYLISGKVSLIDMTQTQGLSTAYTAPEHTRN